MIPRSNRQLTDYPSPDWKKSLREAITDPEDLLKAIDLPRSRWLNGAIQAAQLFPLKAPRGYVSRIQSGTPNDPLLRQILPLTEETELADGYISDPVGDQGATRQPGLLQKYHGRSLLITTGACAIHCRYCFRRHFPYNESHAGGHQLDHILQTLKKDSSQEEVILSGGDPLMLDDHVLTRFFERLSGIQHIKRIRLHTRLPIVLPERITPELLQIFRQSRQNIIMVIHCNHSQEIDASVADALKQLADTSCRLFNQSVLLRGVNDSVDTLCELSIKLFDHQVQPYYLHQLDKVAGAHHFDIDPRTTGNIYKAVRSQLPGYLVPQLVQEIAGEPYKQPISHCQ